MYDLLIRNGRVVDGTGNPWFRADVGVKDGSIAAIGRIEDTAERVVDADGLYVAPGFIDVHCHADFTVLDPNNPRDFKLRQGITTECAGQCGESAAPVNPDTLDLLKAYVAFEAPVDGVLSWRWRTFDEYLRELEAFPIPTNFVPMVGHGTVRIDAMGFENRPPTENELARMKATVREAMEAGAFGFSVGLAYAPGDYAQSDEVIELAKVSAAYGGMFGTHMRDYGDRIFEALEGELRGRSRGEAAGGDLPHWSPGRGERGEDRRGPGHHRKRPRGRAGGRHRRLPPGRRHHLAPAAAALGERGHSGRALPAPPRPRRTQPHEGRDDRGDRENCRRHRGLPLGRDTPRTGAERVQLPISGHDHRRDQPAPGHRSRDHGDGPGAGGALPGHDVPHLQADRRPRDIRGPSADDDRDRRDGVRGRQSVDRAVRLVSAGARLLRARARAAAPRGGGAQDDVLRGADHGAARKGLLREGADADITVFDLDTVTASLARGNKCYPKGIEYVVVGGEVVVDAGRYEGAMAGRVVRRGGAGARRRTNQF